MHARQLGTKTFNIILDISFESFKIYSICVQAMKNGLFLGETGNPSSRESIRRRHRYFGFHLWRLAVDAKTSHELLKEVTGDICDCIESGRLKFFETSMVEYLTNAALQSCPADVRGHHRTIFRNNHGLDVSLDEGLRVVFLELVRIHL